MWDTVAVCGRRPSFTNPAARRIPLYEVAIEAARVVPIRLLGCRYAGRANSKIMSLKIDRDHSRFRQIVRGRIRKNLKQYISQGEMLGRKGDEVVSIPIPRIDIPRFTCGGKQAGGVSQGDGAARSG